MFTVSLYPTGPGFQKLLEQLFPLDEDKRPQASRINTQISINTRASTQANNNSTQANGNTSSASTITKRYLFIQSEYFMIAMKMFKFFILYNYSLFEH